MSSRIDGRGIAWALFFLVVLLLLFDLLSQDSILADFFSGPERHERRIERAMRRALER